MQKGNDIVVAAAGSGKRADLGLNKMYAKIDGIPLLYRTLHRLDGIRSVGRIVVVVRREEERQFGRMMRRYGALGKIAAVVHGGLRRADSVRNGLRYLLDCVPSNLVLVHDGARPFVSSRLIDRLADAAKRVGAAIPVIEVDDTVRRRDGERTEVVDRSLLLLTQTPQAFRKEMIETCFLSERQLSLQLTDDAAYLEREGFRVETVEGEKSNIKITRGEDIAWAECLLARHPELNIAL